ncbi:MAG: hypothetical protein KF778_14485 [Rhodocyclaceae bacterium]|nr:hypothetical protein [Rhodocyclaceae bacterium]MBX3669604.1 hypothetical protein [Rhodocyclaceae bacterium]
MKIALRIALALTLVPPLLALAGMAAMHLFGCSGMDHIETCATPGAFPYIAPLVAMAWVSVFTTPIGLLVLILLLVVRRLRGRK